MAIRAKFTDDELQNLACGEFDAVTGATIPTAGDRFIVQLLAQQLIEMKLLRRHFEKEKNTR